MPTYPYEVPGVAAPLALKPGFWRQHLLQGDVRLPREGRQFPVALANGKTVQAEFRRVLLGFDIPDLEVGGTTYQYGPRMPAWLVVWCFLPLALIVLGGAIPVLFGVLATLGNLRVMRQPAPGAVKAGASIGLTLAALGAVLMLNSLINHLLNR